MSAAEMVAQLSALAAAAPAAHDAEMIALCERHPKLIHACNHGDHDQDVDVDDCPVWQAYAVSRDAISDWRPATPAGLAALVRVALVEATNADGEVVPECTMAADWSWNVAMSLLRLHDAGRLA